jgi:4-hydroxythreonine-4-phosphate dehydrogenase
MRFGVTRPVLTVVGSASRVSHDQFGELARELDIAALTIAPEALRRGVETHEVRHLGQALDVALLAGSDVALAIDHRANVDLHEGPQLVASLATLVAPRLPKLGGLVVTGGETARAMTVRCGISGLRLRGELEPGVPVGISIGAAEIPVVTKAGAFGSNTTLVRCRAALRGDTVNPS